MKIEQSYGAVVFKGDKVLIEKMVLGHTSIPKGHVEANETPTMTCLREIKEETNIDVDVDTNYEYKTAYSPSKDVYKHVSFFVAFYKSGEIKVQKEEVIQAMFVDVNKAIEMVTYPSDKQAILGAYKYLVKLGKL